MAELVIALDVPEHKQAVALAEKLSIGLSAAAGQVWFKVGMELYTAAGPAVVEALKALGFSVFLDLKYHDIPNTVAGAMRAAARLGVDMANIHICGGQAMTRAAVAGAQEGAAAVAPARGDRDLAHGGGHPRHPAGAGPAVCEFACAAGAGAGAGGGGGRRNRGGH